MRRTDILKELGQIMVERNRVNLQAVATTTDTMQRATCNVQRSVERNRVNPLARCHHVP